MHNEDYDGYEYHNHHKEYERPQGPLRAAMRVALSLHSDRYHLSSGSVLHSCCLSYRLTYTRRTFHVGESTLVWIASVSRFSIPGCLTMEVLHLDPQIVAQLSGKFTHESSRGSRNLGQLLSSSLSVRMVSPDK
jgi:hypothetical protein